jgi:hypothetical protein
MTRYCRTPQAARIGLVHSFRVAVCPTAFVGCERLRSYNTVFSMAWPLDKVHCHTNNNNKGMRRNSVQDEPLKIALRVLEAYSNHTPPRAADEAHLRKVANETTMPGDELACQIVQAELRKLRRRNKAVVSGGAVQPQYRDAYDWCKRKRQSEWLDATRRRSFEITR